MRIRRSRWIAQLAPHLGSRLLEELGRQLTTEKAGPKTKRGRVERLRKRGHYDRETIDAILDAGIICHVGFVHERAPIDTFDFGPALHFPAQAQFHPLRYLNGLARAIIERGGACHGGTHVTAVQGGRAPRVRTELGFEIRAGSIVVATNTPVNDRWSGQVMEPVDCMAFIGRNPGDDNVYIATGVDTVHVGEIGYSTADDAAILQRGRGEERIVITLDADFHALLALSRAATPSVIRIRIEGLDGKKAAGLIQAFLIRLYRRPEARGSFNGTAKPQWNSPSATTFMISQSNILRAVSRPNNGFHRPAAQPRPRSAIEKGRLALLRWLHERRAIGIA